MLPRNCPLLSWLLTALPYPCPILCDRHSSAQCGAPATQAGPFQQQWSTHRKERSRPAGVPSKQRTWHSQSIPAAHEAGSRHGAAIPGARLLKMSQLHNKTHAYCICGRVLHTPRSVLRGPCLPHTLYVARFERKYSYVIGNCLLIFAALHAPL